MFGLSYATKKIGLLLSLVICMHGLAAAQDAESAVPAEDVPETVEAAETEDPIGRIGTAMDRFASEAPDEGVETPGGLGTFIETVLILGLFILGIYGVLRFVQKKRGTTTSGVETIRVLSSLSAGGNRMLQLVGVGDQVFFIGIADNAINVISEITDRETIDWIRMVHSKGEAAGSEGFVEKLFSLLGRESKEDVSKRTESKVDFLEQQKKRLSRMQKD